MAEGGRDWDFCIICEKEIPLAYLDLHEFYCSKNNAAFPKSKLRDHYKKEHTKASKGPSWLVPCQYCGIKLAFSTLQDHQDYCGTRTKYCGLCKRNVMLKDLKVHPANCDMMTKEVGVGQARPYLNPEPNIRTTRNILPPDAASRSLPRTTRFPESRLYNGFSRDQPPRQFDRRNIGLAQGDGNKAGILMTCSFCDQLCPEEDFIDHMMGCNTVPSFSQRSSAGFQSEYPWGPWEQHQSNQNMGGRQMPPFQHDTNNNHMLPCEFCGGEDFEFLPQDKCAFCSAPAPWVERMPTEQRIPVMNYMDRTEIPDLPRTHIQHQGEIPPHYFEETRQQTLPQPVQDNRYPTNLVTDLHIHVTSDNRRENNIGPRVCVQTSSSHPSDLSAQFHPNFPPSSYEPSFPETAPCLPSLRNEGGRSPTRRTRYNNIDMGYNPFSQSIPSGPQSEHPWGLWEQQQNNQNMGSRQMPPFQRDTCITPCEVCGGQDFELVPEDKCAVCSAPAPWVERTPMEQRIPVMNYMERTEIPDLLRTHIQHQGEIPPHYFEETRQQTLPQPVQGNRPWNGSHPSDLSAQFHPSFPSSSYEPSFPETAPRRPSLRNEGGRSHTRRTHYY
ncbi:TRAF-type zinc finger domain-containing protein 1-like isoform X2 [Sceloporus undulatus]|uniref:TRAF-type zinc finger domain-containing protein 1-like isoform X2 n=1 Tax=Sceloporus undulatus TaxID=8520 RepID=UPI001C4B831A|nr:TRAF-type zinc finger domain-containing protein 1-like isoform X2 [Sceloporus undulatus]